MIAVLADIHANLYALEAVLADMPKVSEIWVLGDSIGEMPYPCEVLDRLMNLPVPVIEIAGNREESLLEAKRGEHSDWWLGTQYRTLAWTTDQLQAHHWDSMSTLKKVKSLKHIPKGALLCHGMPDKVRGLMLERQHAEEAVKDISERWLVCGHTHKPRMFHIEGQTVLNAGSVGLPLDGIGGTACYVLLNEQCEDGDIKEIAFRNITYDVEKVVRDIQKGELSELAPGFSRADILELRTGRHHVISLIEFCRSYAEKYLGYTVDNIPHELWREAEKLWDGSEWLQRRTT